MRLAPKYIGEIKKGAYSGKGILYNPDGTISYEGELKKVKLQNNNKDKLDEAISFSQQSSAEEDTVSKQTNVATSYNQNPHPQKRNPVRRLFSGIAEGIKGAFETILGIVILYLIIGLVTGNLSKWNSKIVAVAQDGFFFVSSLVRGSHTSPSYEEGSAEYAIDQYIQALFQGDLYTAKQLIDNENEYLVESTEAISDDFRMGDATEVDLNFLTDDMKNADYTIDAVGDGSYYVVFQTYDYQFIYEKTMNSSKVYSTMDEVLRTMRTELSKSEKNLKYGVTFQMLMQNGKWIITDIQERSDFLNALTGNFYKMLKEDQENY